MGTCHSVALSLQKDRGMATRSFDVVILGCGNAGMGVTVATQPARGARRSSDGPAPEVPSKPPVCSLLIRPHQARISRYVGGQKRGKAADGGLCQALVDA